MCVFFVSSTVKLLDFSWDGNLIASGGSEDDNFIDISMVKTGEHVGKIVTQKNAVPTAFKFHPTNLVLAYSYESFRSNTCEVKLWGKFSDFKK